jgi:AmmeMemoRadiSam system protein A
MSATLGAHEKETLLALARQSLKEAVTKGELTPWSPEGLPARLLDPCATFVTLYYRGKLRGCVGAVEARRPLAEEVRIQTMAAAFYDPRFSRVQPPELEEISIEISILSPLQELAYKNPEDLLRQIRPEVDGVLIKLEERRATFLPKVWDKIADPRIFLSLLCEKMGVPEDTWEKEQLTVWVYQTDDLGSSYLRA